MAQVDAVSAPKPYREPVWCVNPEHPHGGLRRHTSKPVRVGDARKGGQVTAWLIQADEGPRRVLVNLAHMASASGELDLQAAAALRDGLTVLLEQAGWHGRKRQGG
jgi:hypothetical protein